MIVFSNTRETAEVLSSRLSLLDKKLKQTVHHGSLSKEHRVRSENDFRDQKIKTLVATSSLELGIDIGSVNLVLQYMSPRQVTRLIQRVGRAGHKFGQTSKGIIISGDEDIFESSAIAKKLEQKKLEEIKIHNMAIDVLVNQIIGILMDKFEVTPEDIFKIVKRSYPYKNIKKSDILNLIRFMESYNMLWLNEDKKGITVKRRMKGFKYYFENLSTIPDKRQYRVVSIIENEPIGSLDEEFVAEHGSPGDKFICSGRAWKVIQVEKMQVTVEPIHDIESAIPAWEGELIPVPFEISNEVGKMRRFISKNKDLQEIMKKFNVDKKSSKKMVEIIKNQEKKIVPTDKEIVVEDYKDFVIIHSCFGSKINDTIGRYIAACISRESGVSCVLKIDPYRIMIQTFIGKEKVIDIIKNSENLSEILIGDIQRSSMFKYRFIHVAKRFGILSKSADYSKINLDKIISAYEGTPVITETMNELLVEKMDLQGAEDILETIRNNKIKITSITGLSYLGELGLIQKFNEIMKPLMPDEEIERAFRKRLLSTKVRLICINCGGYNLTKSVREVDKNPSCPKCGSGLIGVVSKYLNNVDKLIKKKKSKKKLTEEEEKQFSKIRRTGDLVLVYGNKAVECLAGRGVGPDTAARVLSMLHPTRKRLYKDILKAEKQFVKTKKYWK